jgi:AcrR family transcriptional regulator
MGQLLERGRRARREEDKRRRRRDLLDAGWALLQAMPYPEVTMAGVAERAGLAKGTAFLYYPTKESLFLALAAERLDAWFADLDAALGPSGPATPPGWAGWSATPSGGTPG